MKNNWIEKLKKKMPKLPKVTYMNVCMECGKEWETEQRCNSQSHCPGCMSGNIDSEMIK